MKKILAFAFAATMVSFAACTSKPTEETETVIEETVVEPVIEAEADTLASDTVIEEVAPAN